MRSYLPLLAQRRFRLLWLGATTSFVGDSVSFVALIWIVYTARRSSASLSWFVAAYTVPVVLGGPLVGVALDRFDRRTLMVADNVTRATLVAGLPVLSYQGVLRPWSLYAFAIVYGVLKMIPLAGVPSLIPEVVQSDQLETANALETTSFYLSAIAGPGLASVLIARLGAINVLWIDSASYLVFALALVRIGPVPAMASAPAVGESSIFRAVRYLGGVPVLLATTAMFMLVNIGEGIVQVLIPVYVRLSLHADAQTYGALLAAAGAAGVVGAVIAGSVGRRLRLGRAIAISEIAAGLGYGILAAKPALPVAFAALTLGAFFLGPLTVWAQTIRMRFIPGNVRGRVFGLMRTMMQATLPLGAIIATPLIGISVHAAAVATGVILLVPAAVALATGSLAEPANIPGLRDDRKAAAQRQDLEVRQRLGPE